MQEWTNEMRAAVCLYVYERRELIFVRDVDMVRERIHFIRRKKVPGVESSRRHDWRIIVHPLTPLVIRPRPTRPACSSEYTGWKSHLTRNHLPFLPLCVFNQSLHINHQPQIISNTCRRTKLQQTTRNWLNRISTSSRDCGMQNRKTCLFEQNC